MACAVAIQSQLAPCNALDMWRLADCYTLPALEKVAVEAALRGFGELPPWSATGAQVLALVQTDSLVAKSEKAVFQWVVCGGGRPGRSAVLGRGGFRASLPRRFFEKFGDEAAHLAFAHNGWSLPPAHRKSDAGRPPGLQSQERPSIASCRSSRQPAGDRASCSASSRSVACWCATVDAPESTGRRHRGSCDACGAYTHHARAGAPA